MKSNYKKMFKSLPLGVLVTNTKGLIIYCNIKAEKILNLKEDKIIKSSLESIFLDRQKIRININKILRNNIDEAYDIFEKMDKNKNRFIGMTITKCTKCSEEERLTIFIKDHTKEFLSQKRHKEIEGRLEKSENKFHSIFNSTLNAIFILDNNGVIKDLNLSSEKLFDIKRKELIGVNIIDFFDEESKKEFYNFWKELSLKKELKGEFRMNLINSKSYDIEYNSVFNFFQDSNLLVFHDITELKLEQKRHDYYLGIVGHELKTPLATIKAFAQISQKYLDRNEKEKIYISLSKIDKHVNELTKLVDELLDVTKIRAEKLQLYKEVFNFDSLVKEVTQEIKKDFPDFNILGKGETNKLVLADKKRIKQILNTLISNAVKYSYGSNKIIIELFSDRNDVILRVRDFGPGIPKNKHREIFEAFSKVKDLKGKISPGLGLALFISSEIAKLHGGKIWAESSTGKGSIFNLMLPTKK